MGVRSATTADQVRECGAAGLPRRATLSESPHLPLEDALQPESHKQERLMLRGGGAVHAQSRWYLSGSRGSVRESVYPCGPAQPGQWAGRCQEGDEHHYQHYQR